MKQPPLLLNICTFKMKSNLQTFLILKNDTETRAIANLYSSKYCCEKKLKTCQEWPHLVVLWRCFIRQPLAQGDHFWKVPRVVDLYTGFTVLLHWKQKRIYWKGNWGQGSNVCLKWFFLIRQNGMNQTWPKYKGHSLNFLKSHKKWWYHYCK